MIKKDLVYMVYYKNGIPVIRFNMVEPENYYYIGVSKVAQNRTDRLKVSTMSGYAVVEAKIDYGKLREKFGDEVEKFVVEGEKISKKTLKKIKKFLRLK